MRNEVLRGHLDLLLLATVAAEPAHGYRIVEEVRGRSSGAFDLSEGTVYPALYRLERRGLLSSRWALVARRRRRVYSLTRKGRRALAEQRRDWVAFAAAVRGVVGET
jgi:PadR family transcriptional regulator, regulatory protein PadR